VRFISSTYDQENRLIRVTTANGNRSEFSYDGMSRRVETREYQAGSLASTTRYLYDGLLPIAELDTSNAVTRTITRGTDLSGSMQGAGGIGGILATNGNEYSYDGNGNVRDIISASGLNVAHYEYDPFGNKTVSSGSYSSQPYQWSGKEFHQPSGMVYYLYRFYSPQLGRWINRDPIEEAGGINLYGFVGNDGIGKYDLLGLADVIIEQETVGTVENIVYTATIDPENAASRNNFNTKILGEFIVKLTIDMTKFNKIACNKILKWRQKLEWKSEITGMHITDGSLTYDGKLLDNFGDKSDPNRSTDWYYGKQYQGPSIALNFGDKPRHLAKFHQFENNRITVRKFYLELVLIDNKDQASGGTVLWKTNWGFRSGFKKPLGEATYQDLFNEKL